MFEIVMEFDQSDLHIVQKKFNIQYPIDCIFSSISFHSIWLAWNSSTENIFVDTDELRKFVENIFTIRILYFTNI